MSVGAPLQLFLPPCLPHVNRFSLPGYFLPEFYGHLDVWFALGQSFTELYDFQVAYYGSPGSSLRSEQLPSPT